MNYYFVDIHAFYEPGDPVGKTLLAITKMEFAP